MNSKIENFIESLLFAAGRPLRLSEIRTILENEGIKVDLAEIRVGLNNLDERYKDSSLELSEVASGLDCKSKRTLLIFYLPCGQKIADYQSL